MADESPAAILEFRDVRYAYPSYDAGTGKSFALDDVSLHFPAGRRTAILGHNGSGKSTLLLHGNGILQPNSGTVLFDGKALTYSRKALMSIRQRVGVIFQHPDEQLFSGTVAQDISFGPLNLNLDEAEARERVVEAAALCDITHRLEQPTHALSGGEKARVALAGVLAMRPELLLIDEPTASLDPPMRRRIFSIFGELNQQGTTLILATHEVEIAQRWADYVVIMRHGRVAASGTPEGVFGDGDLMTELGFDEPWYESL